MMPVLQTLHLSVNDASWIIIYDTRVAVQTVASLTDDCRGIIYDCNMLIVTSYRGIGMSVVASTINIL
jgi:hypothetical protein